MTLLQLRYFKAVCEFHSVTKAADELFISRTAISRSINALEQESDFSYRSLNNDAARADRSYHEHTAILNAIIEQKADLAEQKAREHVDRLIERVRYDDRPDASVENGLLLSL